MGLSVAIFDYRLERQAKRLGFQPVPLSGLCFDAVVCLTYPAHFGSGNPAGWAASVPRKRLAGGDNDDLEIRRFRDNLRYRVPAREETR